MHTLMQKMTRMTKRATTIVHMTGLCNYYLETFIYYPLICSFNYK